MKRRTDRQKAQNIEMKIRRPNGKRFSKVKKPGPSQTRLIKIRFKIAVRTSSDTRLFKHVKKILMFLTIIMVREVA
jgi:hypothetical protein